jgi:hypothetical protein
LRLAFIGQGDNPVIRNITGTGAASELIGLTADDLDVLGDGAVSVQTTVTDAAGNSSTSRVDDLFTLDTQAPAEPSVTVLGGERISLSEAVNDGVVTVAADAGVTVDVVFRVADATITHSFTSEGPDNPETIRLTTVQLDALGDGVVSIETTVTDMAGNTSTSTASGFTLDTIGPASAAVELVGNGQFTAAAALAGVVSVTAEEGAAVEVSFIGQGDNSVIRNITGTGAASEPIELTADDLDVLGDGAVSVQTTVTDAAGNSSTSRVDDLFTLDTQAPAEPSVTVLGGERISLSEAVNDGVVTVAADAGVTVDVVFRVADATITHSFTSEGPDNPETIRLTATQFATLGGGVVSVDTKVTDAAGNSRTNIGVAEFFALGGDASDAADAFGRISDWALAYVSVPPSADDYSLIGVQGVTVSNVNALNVLAADATANGIDVLDPDEIRDLANLIGQAGEPPGSVPSSGDLQVPQLSNILPALTQSVDDGSFDSSAARLQSLANIIAHAGERAVYEPSLDDLHVLELQNLSTDQLSNILTVITLSVDDGSGINSVAKLQSRVDAVNTVFTAELSGVAQPIEDDYKLIGITGIESVGAERVNALTASVRANYAAVAVVSDLQGLVNILDQADGVAELTPVVASYAQIGVIGIDQRNIGAMNALVASTSDAGTGVDSFAELNALAKIIDLADGRAESALTVNDFAVLRIAGVEESNLNEIVRAIAESANDAGDVSTLTKIQNVVNQFLVAVPDDSVPETSVAAIATVSSPVVQVQIDASSDSVIENISASPSASAVSSVSDQGSASGELTTSQPDRMASVNQPEVSSGVVGDAVRAAIEAQSDIGSQRVDAFGEIVPERIEPVSSPSSDLIAARQRLATPLDEIIDSAFSIVLDAGAPDRGDATAAAFDERRGSSRQDNAQVQQSDEETAANNAEVSTVELPDDEDPVASIAVDGWLIRMEEEHLGFDRQRQHLAEIAGSANVG